MPVVMSTALRWLARGTSLLLAAIFLAFAAGEILFPHSGPPTRLVEWLGIALLAAAALVPLLGWRWELPAAIVSLASLAVFVVVVRFGNPLIIAIVATPGLLYIAGWLGRRRRIPARC